MVQNIEDVYFLPFQEDERDRDEIVVEAWFFLVFGDLLLRVLLQEKVLRRSHSFGLSSQDCCSKRFWANI